MGYEYMGNGRNQKLVELPFVWRNAIVDGETTKKVWTDTLDKRPWYFMKPIGQLVPGYFIIFNLRENRWEIRRSVGKAGKCLGEVVYRTRKNFAEEIPLDGWEACP